VSVVVIGLNHRTVPIELLERFAVSSDALSKALTDLCGRTNIAEAVVLSTCNRTEVYAIADRFHPAYGDIRDFLCDLASLAPEELTEHLYSDHDRGAVRHLFSVAAGLESTVLGESEILGQVKTAWDRAKNEGLALVVEPFVPPRGRGRQAGPHRNGHRSINRVGVPRRSGNGARSAWHVGRTHGLGRRCR
jgi:glutamyl-tRNA reductase